MTESKALFMKIQTGDYPVSISVEIRKARQRIRQLKRISAWLRSYPDDPDYTLQIRKDIAKNISWAIAAINEIQQAHQGKRKPITKNEFDLWMKLHCPDLWDYPVKFER